MTSASQPMVAYSSSSGYTASSWRAGDTLRPNQRQYLLGGWASGVAAKNVSPHHHTGYSQVHTQKQSHESSMYSPATNEEKRTSNGVLGATHLPPI